MRGMDDATDVPRCATALIVLNHLIKVHMVAIGNSRRDLMVILEVEISLVLFLVKYVPIRFHVLP